MTLIENFQRPGGEDWRWADLSGVAAGQAATARGGADWSRWRVGDRLLWVLVDGRIVKKPKLGAAHGRAGLPLADSVTAEGVALDLGPEHASAGLIEIVHVSTGGPAHVAHRYRLAADAQASVIETYVSAGDAAAWVNSTVEIELDRGARLMRAVRRLEGADVTATETAEVRVGQAASYAATTLLAGAGSARAEHRVELAGAGAFASVDGAALASGRAKPDVMNRFVHAVPQTTGRQTWRLVASDSAVASIIGRIEVVRGAQKTDAEQSLKGLLFDRTATINAKPELEIFADDVKAAHGCAIGALDPMALFYLRARGVPAPRARALLTQAFVRGALETAGDEAARDALLACASDWLETHA
ncbi:MAG: SufD family Fe-S cluster assembly protein [Sphingomonadaceae bacterium]|nr:SufD family Fe-S cluster assembly protein [Sphingomonadaceae bacterium]